MKKIPGIGGKSLWFPVQTPGIRTMVDKLGCKAISFAALILLHTRKLHLWGVMACCSATAPAAYCQGPSADDSSAIPAAQPDVKTYESGPMSPPRKARVFGFNNWHRGLPYGVYNPWFYGYDFGDVGAGYYGGSNYSRYYAYSRGTPSLGDFPDSLPGKVWTNDPRRTPYLDQMPHFYNTDGDWPTGPIYPGENPNLNRYGSSTPPGRPSGRPTDFAGNTRGSAAPVLPKSGDKQNDGKGPSTGIAMIRIDVPLEAALWLEDVKTKQQGKQRFFVTPPLEASLPYAYKLKAVWEFDGRQISQEKSLVVRSGEKWTVVMDDKGVATEKVNTEIDNGRVEK
jgi:uncharacterized protein (TIGR03000 family)